MSCVGAPQQHACPQAAKTACPAWPAPAKGSAKRRVGREPQIAARFPWALCNPRRPVAAVHQSACSTAQAPGFCAALRDRPSRPLARQRTPANHLLGHICERGGAGRSSAVRRTHGCVPSTSLRRRRSHACLPTCHLLCMPANVPSCRLLRSDAAWLGGSPGTGCARPAGWRLRRRGRRRRPAEWRLPVGRRAGRRDVNRWDVNTAQQRAHPRAW